MWLRESEIEIFCGEAFVALRTVIGNCGWIQCNSICLCSPIHIKDKSLKIELVHPLVLANQLHRFQQNMLDGFSGWMEKCLIGIAKWQCSSQWFVVTLLQRAFMPPFLCPKKSMFRFCNMLCKYSACHTDKLFFCLGVSLWAVDVSARPSKRRYQILFHIQIRNLVIWTIP